MSDIISEEEMKALIKKEIIKAGKAKGISNSKIKGILRELDL